MISKAETLNMPFREVKEMLCSIRVLFKTYSGTLNDFAEVRLGRLVLKISTAV